MPPIVTDAIVIRKIVLMRGVKVMLDVDLAELYGTETKQLKRSVRRNIERFPEDFMFELNKTEMENLRCQIGTSSWGGSRYSIMAFTEQGVAMLSSILKSPQAVAVNIQIIRVFTRMRQLLVTQKDILLKLEKLERTVGKHTRDFETVFAYLKELLNPPLPTARRIGFRQRSTNH